MSEGRYELKYAVPIERVSEIRAFIAPYVRPDKHGQALFGEARGYLVNSVYFDDAHLSGYAGRLEEHDIRNRVRVRTYGLAGETWPVFLECKRKLRAEVIKHRVKLADTAVWAASRDERPWSTLMSSLEGSARRKALRFAGVVEHQELFPVCSTHYIREVYVDGERRFTVDYEVRGSVKPDLHAFQHEGTYPLIPAGWAVLELKFSDCEPRWMRELCRAFHLVAEPISKFGLAMALGLYAHRPEHAHRLMPPTILRHGAWP